LFTAAQAANYLGYKSVEVLRRFPVRPLLIGKRQRWDRTALDRYLDGLSGIEARPEPRDEAQAAFDRWDAENG
jgi:hypothetical protein